MAGRFERRYSLPENLYIDGSPVVIAAGALLKDTVTGKMLAQLKLKNIGVNDIQAVKVKLKAYEPNGEEVEGVEEFQYIDLNAGHGDEFGQKTPIYFPNNSTRKFDISVTEVVLRGAEPWESDPVEWKPLPTQKLINSLNNIELEKQYKIEVGEGKRADQTPKYIPDITLDLFRCTCGDINPENTAVCLTCGRNKDLEFKATDTEMLREKTDVRLEEEKVLSEQKAQELAVKKEKIKKLSVKVGIISGIVLVLIIGAVVAFNIFNNFRRESIINNSGDLITQTTWKSLDNSDKTISLNKKGGSYGEWKVSSWNYKAPVLNITYLEGTDDLFSSSPTEEKKVKLTLSWYSDDILQLATDGGKECFVEKSKYDEAVKIKKGLETSAPKVEEDGDDSIDDGDYKITASEAEELAKNDFSYSSKRILQEDLENYFSSSDTVSNVRIGSVTSEEESIKEDYKVVINGSYSVYDMYGDYKDHETFSVTYYVSFDGSDVEWDGDTY